MVNVAVVIANHNYGRWLLDAVKSAINQDYTGKINLYIVNSGCTDESWTELEKLFNRKFELKEVNSGFKIDLNNNRSVYIIDIKENLGPSYARNVAINEALTNNEYVAILDADDIYYTNKVSSLMNVVAANPHIGVVYGDYDIWNIHTGNIIREYKEPFDKNRLNHECVVHSGALISKAALVECKDEFGYYDNHMRTCEDYDLWVRISEKYMIYHVPESLSLVRNHNQNSTSTVDKSVWNQNWSRIVDKMKARNG